MKNSNPRRDFIKSAMLIGGSVAIGNLLPGPLFAAGTLSKEVPLSGQLWVYASKYPPDWDCTPILEQVFSDFKYAGLEGIEMMESILRHDDVVPRVSELIEKYGIPVTGSTYYGDMWDRSKKEEILEDVELVVNRLQQLGASTFGITVGNAERIKTSSELDAQGEVLHEVLKICDRNGIQGNLHNHIFEVENNLYDFKETLKRVPEIKLGPDLNWLIRAGIDPIWFIETYGRQMIYLHIRDQDAQGQWTHVVGEGVTDFPGIALALKEIGFSGRAAIELAFEQPPKGPIAEDWAKSREYVKQVFGW